MKKDNKTCVCCGKKYTYCNRCEEYANEPVWKAIFHNDNCRKVFTLISDYLGKAATKEKTVEGLKECDLSVEFTPSINKAVKDVMNSTAKTVNTTEKAVKKETETKKISKSKE